MSASSLPAAAAAPRPRNRASAKRRRATFGWNVLGLVIAAFLALFLWQGGNFFRRNRPGLYRPDAPPEELLPQG